MSAFVATPDYGPEIVPGARVMDLDGRRGTVVTIEDRCHWNCDESARQWRPRAAYVEWDGRSGAGYAEPEGLARIPAAWGAGFGIVGDDSRTGRARPFQPTVVRLRVTVESTVSAAWHLMNRKDRGWGELSFPYESWHSLLAEWDVERGEPDRDEHGWFVPVWPRRGHA